MNQFLMLRDGREMGPFSIEELKQFALRPFDLIWIVGQSISWKYPDEIDELLPLVQNPEEAGKASDSTHTFSFEEDTTDSLATSASERSKKRRTVSTVSFALVLLAGIVAAAVFITRDWTNTSTGKVSIKKQVVAKDGFIIPEEAAASISNDFRNAITKEFIPAEDTLKAKKDPPKNLKKLVSIESNDYKVGVLGGINKLKLTISNNSDVLIDEITIQIDYLKRNGDVVQKEIISEKDIKPQSSKTIDIAPSKRGIKVSYKVIAVDSEENKKLALMEI